MFFQNFGQQVYHVKYFKVSPPFDVLLHFRGGGGPGGGLFYTLLHLTCELQFSKPFFIFFYSELPLDVSVCFPFFSNQIRRPSKSDIYEEKKAYLKVELKCFFSFVLKKQNYNRKSMKFQSCVTVDLGNFFVWAVKTKTMYQDKGTWVFSFGHFVIILAISSW